MARVHCKGGGGTAVIHDACAAETSDGEVLSVEIEHTGIVDSDVDEAAGSHRALSGELQRAFLNRQSAESRGGRSHHVAGAGEQEGAEAGLGEVGGGIVARDDGITRLAAAHEHQRFSKRACRTVVELQIGADDRRGCGAIVEDQAAIDQLEARIGTAESDVAIGAQSTNADDAIGHCLRAADVGQ